MKKMLLFFVVLFSFTGAFAADDKSEKIDKKYEESKKYKENVKKYGFPGDSADKKDKENKTKIEDKSKNKAAEDTKRIEVNSDEKDEVATDDEDKAVDEEEQADDETLDENAITKKDQDEDVDIEKVTSKESDKKAVNKKDENANEEAKDDDEAADGDDGKEEVKKTPKITLIESLNKTTKEKISSKSKSQSKLQDELKTILSDFASSEDGEICDKVRILLKDFTAIKKTDIYQSINNSLKKCPAIKEVARKSYMPCKTTPTISPSFTLKQIAQGNNLTRKPGSSRKAAGQYIMIKGKVTDEECVPVAGAVIEIWQTDSKGKNLNDYKLKNSWQLKDPDYDKNFTYSGKTQTNNLGEFAFYTILPGVKNTSKNIAPHINFSVKQDEFSTLKSRMYLAKHPLNNQDDSLAKLRENEPESDSRVLLNYTQNGGQSGLREYNFPIVLKGLNKFERY